MRHTASQAAHISVTAPSLSAPCAPRAGQMRRRSWALSPFPASPHTLTVEFKENPALPPLLSHFDAIIISSTFSCQLRLGGSVLPQSPKFELSGTLYSALLFFPVIAAMA